MYEVNTYTETVPVHISSPKLMNVFQSILISGICTRRFWTDLILVHIGSTLHEAQIKRTNFIKISSSYNKWYMT